MPQTPPAEQQSSAERVYRQVRAMAVRYELRPGERVNEVELARRLGSGRTPLREALNRLLAEGLLASAPDRGFVARSLDPREVFEQYQLRAGIEAFAVELACARGDGQALEELERFVRQSREEPEDASVERLVELDEQFHERLVSLSGNAQILRQLRTLNAGIRFVRWIAMREGRRQQTQAEHLAIVEAVRASDAAEARHRVLHHISRRMDQIVDVIRAGIGEIYLR